MSLAATTLWLLIATSGSAMAGVDGALAPPPGFHVVRREEAFDLRAGTLGELSRVLEALRRDHGWHGRTALSIERRVDLVSSREGCRFGGLRTTLVVTVTLPHLVTGDVRRRRALEQAWQRASEGLSVHEEGHVRIGVDEARASHGRLAAIGILPDCRAARRALVREELRFRQRQAFLHERYDRRTDSGARQGAFVRVEVDAAGRAP